MGDACVAPSNSLKPRRAATRSVCPSLCCWNPGWYPSVALPAACGGCCSQGSLDGHLPTRVPPHCPPNTTPTPSRARKPWLVRTLAPGGQRDVFSGHACSQPTPTHHACPLVGVLPTACSRLSTATLHRQCCRRDRVRTKCMFHVTVAPASPPSSAPPSRAGVRDSKP